MPILLLSFIAAGFYVLATFYQSRQLLRESKAKTHVLTVLGAIALAAQIGALHFQLITPYGLDLDFFNALSLITAAVTLLILIALQRMQVEILLLLLYPFACIAVLLAQFAPEGTSNLINEQPGILLHITLSILAYGLLTIAAFQALLLFIQEHQLKNKNPTGLIRNFPPLQTMESLLFGFLWAGWTLLSASLLSGWFFVENLLAQHLAHKTFLSCFAWVVFALLLAGRQKLGWRGHKAIGWTLGGFFLLMLAYFGSKVVREYILHI